MGNGVQADRLEDGDLPAQFGRYTLVSVLGEGGMARVFRARLEGPEGFRKDVAVKVIHAAVAQRSDQLRRALINEGRLGGRLNHANVVNTYDYGETDGQPWVAMALVEGITLDDVLRNVGPPPPSVTAEIGRQICAGLHHAHELKTDDGQSANLVHRDLKPANVMIGWDGVVKVMDFGIAKASQLSDGTTATGALKGTAAYMSPEQLRAQPLDRRSDVFALGVMLAETATGRRLFRAESMPAIVLAIVSLDETLTGRLAPVREAVPGLAPILERCLVADAEQRYPSAAAVGKDLRLLAQELPSEPSLEDWLEGLQRGISVVTAPVDSPLPLVELPEASVLPSAAAAPLRPDDPHATVHTALPPRAPLSSSPSMVPLDSPSTVAAPVVRRRLGLAVLVLALGAAGGWLLQSPSSPLARGSVSSSPDSVEAARGPGSPEDLATVQPDVAPLPPSEGLQGPVAESPDSGRAGSSSASADREAGVASGVDSPPAPVAILRTAERSETAEERPRTEPTSPTPAAASEPASGVAAQEAIPSDRDPVPVAGRQVPVFVSADPWASWALSGDASGSGTETPYIGALAAGHYTFVLTAGSSGATHRYELDLKGTERERRLCWSFVTDSPCGQ